MAIAAFRWTVGVAFPTLSGLRSIRAILASLICFAVVFVTSGAARNAHERIEHRGEAMVALHDASAPKDVEAAQKGPTAPAAPGDAHPPHHDREHCATCVSLASLGKMPNAPPAAVFGCVVAAPAAHASVPTALPPTASTCLNAAVSERGPPIV